MSSSSGERLWDQREDEEAEALIFLFRGTPPLLGPQPSDLRATKGHFLGLDKSAELTHSIKEGIVLPENSRFPCF
ncbi:hypothetical protein ABIG06_002280 [Bradyrhizobium sp. USDA 326]|uniref:hypothetical protein n=1 Tax=unclassified Bradyrhizobium TaxID=2631580 RepID=UPI003518A1CE